MLHQNTTNHRRPAIIFGNNLKCIYSIDEMYCVYTEVTSKLRSIPK